MWHWAHSLCTLRESTEYQQSIWVTRELTKLRDSTSCPPDVFPSLRTASVWIPISISAVSLRGVKDLSWINFKFGTRRQNCNFLLSCYFPVLQSHARLPSLTTLSMVPFSWHFSKGTFQKKTWHKYLQSGSINAVHLHTVQVMSSAQVPESHSQLAVANFDRA